MKQIARVKMNDGNIQIVKLKPGEKTFSLSSGGLYNTPSAAEIGRRKSFFHGVIHEANYFEGQPNPVGSRAFETVIKYQNGSGQKSVPVTVTVPAPKDFTADDYERLWGDPIQMWLARGMQRAMGGMVLQYIQLGVSVVTLLVVGWLGYHYFSHPWS
jgi:hypothetical protein